MKILQFIETGGPGGAEQAVLKLSRALSAQGHIVYIGSMREGWFTKQVDALRIPRALFTSRGGFDLGLIMQLYKYIKSHQIEVIHAHLLDSNAYCTIAALIARIPCIATEHGDIHHIEKKRFSKLKIKIISILAKKIISVSAFSKNALIAAGMNKEKIIIIGNPIEIEEHQSKYNSRSEIHPGLQEDEWIWVHVGNLRPVKDQTTLIKGFALAQVSSSRNHKLLIIGDGALKDELITLCRSLKISDNVIFLGHRDDVNDILPHCDGFILSSLSEALPISLLEAMRSELVIIASSVGGIPEVIQNGQTGYLFSAKSSEELSQKILFVLEHQHQAKETAHHAHEFVKSTFETNLVVKKLIELYSSVLS